MSTFAWYSLQIVVALIVFVTIGETVGVADRGMAPALVSMGVAFAVTQSVSGLIDWRRRRKASRPPPLPPSVLGRFAVGDELDRHTGGGVRANRHAGDSPELPRRRRIGHNPRKLV